MHQCRECHRVNPQEAAFCFYDGFPLQGASSAGEAGSINFATWAFPTPFVFPNGDKCHNFLQLATTCHRNSQEAREMLKAGYLESFFGSVGRVDLAMAARAAASSPDQDRGLDDLLGKMPGCPLEPAELELDPREMDLGTVQVGEDRQFELTMTNKGDRLLYGKASVDDCPWLVLGESGITEKVVQFFDKATLPVQVRGRNLRAGSQPQKGEITVETNGGTITVAVMVTAPAKPFPDDVLAGARTPRELAGKAKAHPKEAAALLEQGAVARWYESNGWAYPVQGPTASGVAAVQQFFETLGLVKTPKVELSETAITLQGKPGQRVEHLITANTREKRYAVAHATSDQPWLTIGKTVYKGQSASIPVIVESIPGNPNSTLKAQVKVTANGGQRFDIPVSLAIGDGPVSAPPVSSVPDNPFADLGAPAQINPFAGQQAPPETNPFADLGRPAPSRPVAVVPVTPIDEPPPAAPVPVHAVTPAPVPVPHASAPSELVAAPQPSAPSAPVAVAVPASPDAPAPGGRDRKAIVIRLLPLAIVLLGLLSAIGRDLFFREPAEEPLPEIDYANPVLDIHFHDKVLPNDFVRTPSMRFGLGIPDPSDKSKFKTKLIYDEFGRTCNVAVMVNKSVEYLWGIEQGSWRKPGLEPLGKDEAGNKLIGYKVTWERSGPPRISVTQFVEVVPGGLSADGKKRLLDTCLIYYHITNDDDVAHDVGLRFLLDTYIGANDAVPFTIAGANELCNTYLAFNRPEDVPEYISALEHQDVQNPGTVAHISLKYGAGLEPPTRVTLGAWPAAELRKEPGGQLALMQNTRWSVPVLSMELAKNKQNPIGDSAVTLYWDAKTIPPKQTRRVGFAYGLGSVTGEKSGGLGISTGGVLVAEKEFTITAYVKNPPPGTTATLEVPRRLSIVGNDAIPVPVIPPGSASPYSPITWRVKASLGGMYTVRVNLSTGVTASKRIAVEKAELFK